MAVQNYYCKLLLYNYYDRCRCILGSQESTPGQGSVGHVGGFEMEHCSPGSHESGPQTGVQNGCPVGL